MWDGTVEGEERDFADLDEELRCINADRILRGLPPGGPFFLTPEQVDEWLGELDG